MRDNYVELFIVDPTTNPLLPNQKPEGQFLQDDRFIGKMPLLIHTGTQGYTSFFFQKPGSDDKERLNSFTIEGINGLYFTKDDVVVIEFK